MKWKTLIITLFVAVAFNAPAMAGMRHGILGLCEDGGDADACDALIKSGKYKRADDLTKAYYWRGVGYCKEGQYDKAIHDLNKAIRLDGQGWLVGSGGYTIRGDAYYGKHQYDKALADYSKAITEEGGFNVWHYIKRGHAYIEAKQYDQAVANYDEAIDFAVHGVHTESPAVCELYNDRGVAKLRKGDAYGAAADFANAKELGACYAPAEHYYREGIRAQERGDNDKAAAYFAKAKEFGPGGLGELLCQ